MEKRSPPQRSPAGSCLRPPEIPRVARTALGLDPGAEAESSPRDVLERPEAPFVAGGVKPGAGARVPGAAVRAAGVRPCRGPDRSSSGSSRSLCTACTGRGTEPPDHFVFSGPVHERSFKINQS